MEITFRRFSDYYKGIIYNILEDAYSLYTQDNKDLQNDWHETDEFLYSNLNISDNCGFITCLGEEAIGFICWDPRNSPEYVEVGHNAIKSAYKGNGYGKLQLEEAIKRIRSYDGLQRIIVQTNSTLVAAIKNYESVGFNLYMKKTNNTSTAVLGDNLYFDIVV